MSLRHCSDISCIRLPFRTHKKSDILDVYMPQDIFRETENSDQNHLYMTSYDSVDAAGQDSDRHGGQSDRAHKHGAVTQEQKHDKRKVTVDGSNQRKLEPSMKWRMLEVEEAQQDQKKTKGSSKDVRIRMSARSKSKE